MVAILRSQPKLDAPVIKTLVKRTLRFEQELTQKFPDDEDQMQMLTSLMMDALDQVRLKLQEPLYFTHLGSGRNARCQKSSSTK